MQKIATAETLRTYFDDHCMSIKSRYKALEMGIILAKNEGKEPKEYFAQSIDKEIENIIDGSSDPLNHFNIFMSYFNNSEIGKNEELMNSFLTRFQASERIKRGIWQNNQYALDEILDMHRNYNIHLNGFGSELLKGLAQLYKKTELNVIKESIEKAENKIKEVMVINY